MKFIVLISLLILPLLFSNVYAYPIQPVNIEREVHYASDTNLLGSVKVTVHYNSSIVITDGWQIGELVRLVDGKPEPLGIAASRPLNTGNGYVFFQFDHPEIRNGSMLQVWVFFWNQMPSDNGTWTPYADKIIVVIS